MVSPIARCSLFGPEDLNLFKTNEQFLDHVAIHLKKYNVLLITLQFREQVVCMKGGLITLVRSSPT